MCLRIKYSQKPPSKPKKVYKVYVYNENTFWNLYKLGGFKFERGMVIRSTRKKKTLTKSDKKRKTVYKGFHTYTGLKSAKDVASDSESRVVVEFEASPKHFVARGLNHDGTRGEVYTKLKFNKAISK